MPEGLRSFVSLGQMDVIAWDGTPNVTLHIEGPVDNALLTGSDPLGHGVSIQLPPDASLRLGAILQRDHLLGATALQLADQLRQKLSLAGDPLRVEAEEIYRILRAYEDGRECQRARAAMEPPPIGEATQPVTAAEIQRGVAEHPVLQRTEERTREQLTTSYPAAFGNGGVLPLETQQGFQRRMVLARTGREMEAIQEEWQIAELREQIRLGLGNTDGYIGEQLAALERRRLRREHEEQFLGIPYHHNPNSASFFNNLAVPPEEQAVAETPQATDSTQERNSLADYRRREAQARAYFEGDTFYWPERAEREWLIREVAEGNVSMAQIESWWTTEVVERDTPRRSRSRRLPTREHPSSVATVKDDIEPGESSS